ncbi:hypothetical protein DE146DRAFT_671768 [Phaeosphaeria sp. MPI-PUGE-AT-0046c]|nr:hypothetical protein DE146DRAFT_671768 [Phaeosphaeria sp. MPI-PUGE-AT-0046c]
MHHYRSMPPRSTPPPDVVRPQRSIFPENQCTLDQTSSSRSPPPSPRAADFLIIGLFAVRLTKRLIEGLEPYSQSDADISWLSTFLAAYASEYALAKISGPRKDEYVAMYQDIVSRMKRQPRYPMRFMQMNPDGSTRRGGREGGRGEERQMTDGKSRIDDDVKYSR